jgi:hypothetical protein
LFEMNKSHQSERMALLRAVCAAILLSRSASVSNPEVELRRWAHAEGAPLSEAVTLAEVPDGGRTAVATRDLREGEAIISVPRKLMLCVSDVVDALVLRANENRTRFIERSLLEIFLASERQKPTSFWAPFIGSMPRDHKSSHPFYSTKAAMHTVQSSEFSRMMRCAVRRTRRSFADVVSFLTRSIDWAATAAALVRQPADYVRRFGGVLDLQHSNVTVSFDDFAWAHVSTISRIFGLDKLQRNRTDDSCLVRCTVLRHVVLCCDALHCVANLLQHAVTLARRVVLCSKMLQSAVENVQTRACYDTVHHVATQHVWTQIAYHGAAQQRIGRAASQPHRRICASSLGPTSASYRVATCCTIASGTMGQSAQNARSTRRLPCRAARVAAQHDTLQHRTADCNKVPWADQLNHQPAQQTTATWDYDSTLGTQSFHNTRTHAHAHARTRAHTHKHTHTHTRTHACTHAQVHS